MGLGGEEGLRGYRVQCVGGGVGVVHPSHRSLTCWQLLGTAPEQWRATRVGGRWGAALLGL